MGILILYIILNPEFIINIIIFTNVITDVYDVIMMVNIIMTVINIIKL